LYPKFGTTVHNINGSIEAPLIAEFNKIDYYYINTDLVSRGIGVNGNWEQVVAQVVPDVSVGQQIIFSPNNPPVCDLSGQRGKVLTRASFWLTGSDGRLVDTGGNDWSVRLQIEWDEPVVMGSLGSIE
jgi:hypothetical protein